MEIQFLHAVPGQSKNHASVVIPVKVDGKAVLCEISYEALMDHFGVNSMTEGDLVAGFQANRKRIEAVAHKALERSKGQPVLLQTGMF